MPLKTYQDELPTINLTPMLDIVLAQTQLCKAILIPHLSWLDVTLHCAVHNKFSTTTLATLVTFLILAMAYSPTPTPMSCTLLLISFIQEDTNEHR